MAIKLYFLQTSRAIRIAFLLEALELEWEAIVGERLPNRLASEEWKAKVGGKSPTLDDGDLRVTESGAIVEYLCDRYDTESKMIPKEYPARAKCREWLHAAEATYLLHAFPIYYSKVMLPQSIQTKMPEEVEEYRKKLGVNVRKDFAYLSDNLKNSKFLLGDTLTAADIMMHYTASIVIDLGLIQDSPDLDRIKEWRKLCETTEPYKRAVAQTNYKPMFD